MIKTYKIVFLGNTAVGKTTLISQYLYNKTQFTTPTIGIDFLSTSFEINGKTVRLQLWDTAGQERFHSIIGNYTRNTFLAIIVFSVEDLISYERIKNWIKDYILMYNKKEEVKILVVGNKIDQVEESEWFNEEKAREEIKEMKGKLILTSAMTSEGIEELNLAIRGIIAEDLEKGEEDVIEQNAINAQPKVRRCC